MQTRLDHDNQSTILLYTSVQVLSLAFIVLVLLVITQIVNRFPNQMLIK